MNRQEMADVAAKWWAEVVGKPKFDALGHSRLGGLRRGAGESAALVAERFAAELAQSNPIPSDVLMRFEVLLREYLLNEKLEATVCLDVDYEPDEVLRGIAERAGLTAIGPLSFPWKTTMWLDFDEGTVRVRHGYGAPTEELGRAG